MKRLKSSGNRSLKHNEGDSTILSIVSPLFFNLLASIAIYSIYKTVLDTDVALASQLMLIIFLFYALFVLYPIFKKSAVIDSAVQGDRLYLDIISSIAILLFSIFIVSMDTQDVYAIVHASLIFYFFSILSVITVQFYNVVVRL